MLFIPLLILAIVLLILLIPSCYKKAPPTEAIVVTGFGHKEPKVVCGRGVFVIPFVQRADVLNMRIIKIDVKTPVTGVKTVEGVPLWVDSVVTAQVYSDNSSISEEEVAKFGAKDRHAYIYARQQAAISNFLGMKEDAINMKVNDVLQGNLREIVAEMTVMDVLTKRKEFATRVIENAKPDLAKMGLEVVTFNIQDIKDAEDSCGNSHGVVEAIGVEREMEVKKAAEIARARAQRDISIAQADAKREANEKTVEAEMVIAEKNNSLDLRRSALKAEADRAAVDAQAAGQIQEQVQAKTINERKEEAEIARTEKQIIRAEKEAQVEQQRLNAEIQKKADADLYRRQKEADAKKYEAMAAAEALKFEQEQKAEGIRAVAQAEADAIEKKGLAEAKAMDQKAEAYRKYGQAAMAEMIVKVLPEVARQVAEPLTQIDKITIFGGGDSSSCVDGISGNVPAVLAKTFQTVKEATGIDLAEIARGESYDAKVTRNVHVDGLPSALSNTQPESSEAQNSQVAESTAQDK